MCQVTLTGHSRKVTAAKFTSSIHQVVTGGADRTIRLWDAHRAACESPSTLNADWLMQGVCSHFVPAGVQLVEVVSYCSDLVCSENCIISGHYDCKIRVWDSRWVSAGRSSLHSFTTSHLHLLTLHLLVPGGSGRSQQCCRSAERWLESPTVSTVTPDSPSPSVT